MVNGRPGGPIGSPARLRFLPPRLRLRPLPRPGLRGAPLRPAGPPGPLPAPRVFGGGRLRPRQLEAETKPEVREDVPRGEAADAADAADAAVRRHQGPRGRWPFEGNL